MKVATLIKTDGDGACSVYDCDPPLPGSTDPETAWTTRYVLVWNLKMGNTHDAIATACDADGVRTQEICLPCSLLHQDARANPIARAGYQIVRSPELVDHSLRGASIGDLGLAIKGLELAERFASIGTESLPWNSDEAEAQRQLPHEIRSAILVYATELVRRAGVLR